jgi:HPt (histidine-containing phosphotransfer) domain-containing protein
MDEYLTKPFDPDDLLKLVRVFLDRSSESSGVVSAEVGGAAGGPPSGPVVGEPGRGPAAGIGFQRADVGEFPFDLDDLLKRCMGNVGLLKTLLDKFCQRAPGDLERIAASIAAGNVQEAAKCAHAFKGAAGNLSAERLYALAAEVEAQARGREVGLAEQTLERLRAELERCLDAVPTVGARLADKNPVGVGPARRTENES